MAFATNAYLAEHKLPEMLDDLLGKMLVLRPARPLMFMINECNVAEQERRRANAALEEGLSGYPDLTGCNSHMAHCLTEDLYCSLYNLCTPYGGTLDEVIQIGVDVKDHVFDCSCGVAATDAKCYEIFAPLMSKIIARQHPNLSSDYRHETAFSNTLDIPQSYPAPPYPQVCCGFYATFVRAVQDTPFPYSMGRKERRILAAALKSALQTQRIAKGAFAEGDAIISQQPYEVFQREDFTDASVMAPVEDWIRHPPPLDTEQDLKLNLRRDWPDGRVVWHADDDPNLSVWGNIHEHIHMRACGEYSRCVEVVTRMLELGQGMQKSLAQMDCHLETSVELGAVVSNPSLLGTGFTLGIVMRLDKLIRHRWFDKLVNALHLSVRPIRQIITRPYFGTALPDAPGGHPAFSASTEFITHDRPAYVTVESKLTMGVSVRDVVRAVLVAVAQLTEFEELLQRGQSIDSSIEKMT